MNCLERQLMRALDELYEARQGGLDLLYNRILTKYRNIYVSLIVEEMAGIKVDDYCDDDNPVDWDTIKSDTKICSYCQHLLDKT
jgi:hypothetical protein